MRCRKIWNIKIKKPTKWPHKSTGVLYKTPYLNMMENRVAMKITLKTLRVEMSPKPKDKDTKDHLKSRCLSYCFNNFISKSNHKRVFGVTSDWEKELNSYLLGNTQNFTTVKGNL